MAHSQHASSRDMGESPLVPGHSTPLLTITHSSAQLPALQDWGRKREHTSPGKIQKQEEDEFGAGGAEKCAHSADCAQAGAHQVVEPSITAGAHQGTNLKGQGCSALCVLLAKETRDATPALSFTDFSFTPSLKAKSISCIA